jgi:succinate dehydrogenase / fumarate reductase membrane anchor subunit
MKQSSHLRSKLSVARGLGSAKHGVGHWWFQRVTAVALIPLSLWFVASLVSVLLSNNITKVAMWFASPVNALLLSAMLAAMFFHAKLGLQVVIEDYIKCPCMKYGALLANTFFSFAAAFFCIMAVLKLHFLDISASL